MVDKGVQCNLIRFDSSTPVNSDDEDDVENYGINDQTYNPEDVTMDISHDDSLMDIEEGWVCFCQCACLSVSLLVCLFVCVCVCVCVVLSTFNKCMITIPNLQKQCRYYLKYCSIS